MAKYPSLPMGDKGNSRRGECTYCPRNCFCSVSLEVMAFCQRGIVGMAAEAIISGSTEPVM
ncbi:hypothetical protein [Microcystis aeruginosa]|uniref:hypothetical protein n=1 Tax=Microcystis aeruginosa TaxID=1126 RepID=UPI001230F3EA|nr:hypothetical protein [Microcystis aeruginosa]